METDILVALLLGARLGGPRGLRGHLPIGERTKMLSMIKPAI